MLLPPYLPVQDITALFASDKCPDYNTCEFADNDCWYVTFDSEEDTQKVRWEEGGVATIGHKVARGINSCREEWGCFVSNFSSFH